MADASVSLSARIPDPANFLSLVESLSGKVAGVELPVLPTERIAALVRDFRFDIPDSSRWSTTVTADASRIAFTLPDPATLIAPLQQPLAAARDLAAIDFAGAIEALGNRVQALGAQAERDPKAFVTAMFTPSSPVAAELRKSPFMQLLVAIGRFVHAEEIEKAPDDILALATWLQQLVQERIGSVVIAFAAAGEAATLTRRLVRAAGLLDASIATGTLATRREAARAAFAQATTTLTGTVDEAAARAELASANSALAAYVAEVSSILAFGVASASIIGVPQASVRFERLAESVAKVKPQALAEVATSLDALVGQWKTALHPGQTKAGELDATVRRLLQDLKRRIDAFDVSGIDRGIDEFIGTITKPLEQLERFKGDVERELRGVLATLRDAIATVDLAPLRAEFDRVFHEIEGAVGALSGEVVGVREEVEQAIATASAALAEARDFVLDPEHGLKPQIEAVFGELRDLLTQLDIQGTVDSVTGAVSDIASELARIEIAPVVDATVTAIDAVTQVIDKVAPLLVTDDLRQKLSEATNVLREVNFDEIRSGLQQVLDEIIDGINNDALGKISAEYDKAVAAIGKLDPTPVLEALQEEVFDPLLVELRKIKPAETMAPMVAAFAEATASLRKFDPAASLQFLVAFHADIKARFDQISPDRLLEPVTSVLAELRRAIAQVLRIHEVHDALDKVEAAVAPLLQAVDLARWFGQLDGGLNQMREALVSFDPAGLLGPLAGVLRDAFEKTGTVLDRYGLAALFEALTGSGDALKVQLTEALAIIVAARQRAAAIDVAAIIDEFRPMHAALASAVRSGAMSASARSEFTASVGRLDPMIVWSPVQGRAPRAQAGIAAVETDFGSLLGRAEPALATSQQLIDALRILRRPLEAGWELVLNPLRGIVAIPERASIRTILLALFDALDPRRWKAEIEQLSASLVAKLRVLLGATAIASVKSGVDKVSALVDGLNIDALTAALREVHGSLAAQIDALDPAPLLASLRATYGEVVASVQALDPGPLAEELDTVYSRDVIGLVEAISPRDLLLKPLQELFAQISAMLGALDIKDLFAPVLEQLERLREELADGVTRAGTAYKDMLAAIPTAGGTASVSVSVAVG